MNTNTNNVPGGVFGSGFATSGVFGQQQQSANTTQTAFGGSQTSSLFGGQAGTSSGFTSSGATNVLSVFPNTLGASTGSVFGKTETAAVTTSGLFGQTSTALFGQTSQQSLFGQTANSQPSAVFGQTGGLFGKSGGFGQSTSSGGGFGQFVQSSGGFGQSTSSSGAFGQSTQASVFGQTTQSSAGFGQPSSLATTSTTVLFGKPVSTQSSVFPAFQKSETASTSASSNLFGKGSSARSSASSSGLFGKSGHDGEKKVLFGGQSGAFGHGTASQQDTATGGFGSSGLFGKKSKEIDKQSTEKKPEVTGFSFKTEAADIKPPAEFGVFPIKQEKDEKPITSGLFGKGPSTASNSDATSSKTSAIGDGGVARGLFGKPIKEEERPSTIKQEKTDEETSGTSSVRQEEKVTGRTLFGEPVADDSRKTKLSRRGSDEDAKGRKPLLRRMTSATDDIAKKVAIVCKDVEAKFNNANFLRKHFSRYGTVVKVYPNPNKRQATIHFQTHEEAAEAKRRGHTVVRGQPRMTIFWSSYSSATTPRASRNSTEEELARKKRSSNASLDFPQSKRRAWTAADDVNEELQSMSGTQDLKSSLSGTKTASPSRLFRGVRSPEKTTRARSSSPTPSTSNLGDRSEKVLMQSFARTVSRTTTERVHTLELRDKFIRQNRKKKATDLATAKAFQGTCPDMCPEKERYDREDKRRLHPYECLPDTDLGGKNPVVDHRRAVKEYLRSSPDQDEPLAHELRPIGVLKKTMTYLLREIADLGEDGKWGDWFDFLWNRTRGIRKDITQQQLCDRDAVGLIERCVRFHIFCSERLCEEDMHSFDTKINNENLTKCLQTLKEFYYDLETKQKCFCPSEAEFRAYTVLMNLNEGDTQRQVQQLRPEVRNDPQIRFALQVYFALNNNNYIRFFRLVKDGSFAAACIMHRYFTQVRNRALVSMMKGYSMGNRPAQIPIAYLVEMLGFEDEEEATDFGEHYGFIVKDGDMLLDKSEYIEPETAWSMRRSRSLIESKRIVSVGEMINGDVLPPLDTTPPSSSFDSEGRYFNIVELPSTSKGTDASEPFVSAPTSASSLSDQSREPDQVKLEPVESQADSGSEIIAAKAKPVVPGTYVKELAKTLFWEVIDEMCLGIGQEVMQTVQSLNTYGESIVRHLLDDTINVQVRDLCRDVYDEELVRQQWAEMEELEKRRDRVAALLTDDLLEDMLIQESRNLATIKVREIHIQLRRERMERCTVTVMDETVEDVLTEMVLEVSADVFETDVTQRLKKLSELEDCVKLARAGRFFRKWKREYVAVTKLKRSMLAFPSAPCMEPLHKQNQALIPNARNSMVEDGRFYLNRTARLTTESPRQVAQRWNTVEVLMTAYDIYDKLKYELAWQPLHVAGVVGNILLNKVRQHNRGIGTLIRLQWKLLLCLPDESTYEPLSEKTTRQLSDWLRKKFSKGTKPKDKRKIKGEVISLYQTDLPSGGLPKGCNSARLGVCVRTVEGTLSRNDVEELEESRDLFGASGVLFLLPANPPLADDSHVYWKETRKRLTRIFQVKPMYLSLPLVILLPVLPNQSECTKRVLELLRVDDLLDGGQIGAVEVMVVQINEEHPSGVDVVQPGFSEQLCQKLQWLAEESALPPQLKVCFLKFFVENVLQAEYYTPVLQNLKKRKTLGRLHRDGYALLELYNSVVQHMTEVLTAPSLSTVSWPVPEFISSTSTLDTPPAHWNSPDHLEYLEQSLHLLSLPEFSAIEPDTTDWTKITEDLFEYVSEVVGTDSGVAKINLISRVRLMLKKVEADFKERCYMVEGEECCEPSYFNVPWTEFLGACIDYRLTTMDFSDPNITDNQEEEEEEEETEIRVAYFPEELKNFRPPESWKHVESEKSISETPSLDTTINWSVGRARQMDCENRPQEIRVVADLHNQSQVAIEASRTANTVIRALKEEKRRSDQFLKYLETVVQDGMLENMDTGTVRFPVSFTTSPTVEKREHGYGTKSFKSETARNVNRPSQNQAHSNLLGSDDLMDSVLATLNKPSLSETFQRVQRELAANKRENALFEQRLQALLHDF